MIELAQFRSGPETCPYLSGRTARTDFRLVMRLSRAEYARELAAGWRRFGSVLFQPACLTCRECIPIRVPLARFCASRSQRRVLRRNRDIAVEIGEPAIDEERLALYRLHHSERERSRGWARTRMSDAEYIESFVSNCVRTLEFRYRLEGRLVGIAYVGEADDALNSIYAFTSPEYPRRGLGTFDVLSEIAEATRRGKDYLYLGYLVRASRSMSYKASFRPYEVRMGGRWVLEAGASRVVQDAGGSPEGEHAGAGPGDVT